ncbi:MAG: YhdH/YhfP family quinone oxidoreductase [Desulfobulbaceae bacterium]|nr:YhdH/YhfP family quinone oxidoreductase [Candidatus Kapabacteria bacterium]MBS4001243.1 YhdH/YhfP family quinone oxidoreductase [Desulfobulbaceae bacterium]
MSSLQYKAFYVEEVSPNTFVRSIIELPINSLPDNEVLIKVHYSSLNYKDALSAKGHKGVSKFYPHTPGIDAAGVVVESKVPEFSAGDEVIVTGYDLGMNTPGGFGQYIKVPASWIVKKPETLTLKESMILGTAGFTAGICITELQNHNVMPGMGKVLVTGATGGVGSLAVSILAKIGYEVVASTSKLHYEEFLLKMGATEVVRKNMILDLTARPLLSGQWLGVVENVGGGTLSSVIRSTQQHGCVCVVGNVGGDVLTTSVYPFILRGVTLCGIDSASRPMNLRTNIWDKLATDWKVELPQSFVNVVKLDSLSREIDKILDGKQTGRVVLEHDH